MKWLGWFLIVLVHLWSVDLSPLASQQLDAPAGPEAPRATSGDRYHERMCARMCGQYGKARQVCGGNGKTYDNACTAKCTKVAYKPGPCPTPASGEQLAAAPPSDTAPAEEVADERLVGHVKWFNPEKKYGFITGVDGQEVYLEQTALIEKDAPAPKEGDRVRFDVRPGPQGLHAANVSVISEEEEQAQAERRKLIAQGMLEAEPTPVPPPRVELPREVFSRDGLYVIPSR